MPGQTTNTPYYQERQKTAFADFSSSQTETEIIPAKPGNKIEVQSIFISTSATTGTTSLTSGTTGTLIWKVYHKSGSASVSGTIHEHSDDEESLVVTCPGNLFIAVTYYYEAI